MVIITSSHNYQSNIGIFTVMHFLWVCVSIIIEKKTFDKVFVEIAILVGWKWAPEPLAS